MLKSFDTREYALSLMDDFKLKHLPLLRDNVYKCLIAEKDLLSMSDSALLADDSTLFSPCVQESTLIFDALAMVSRYRLSLLPVVNEKNEYKGAVVCERLVNALSELCNAEAEGSVIVLEIAPRDYSLTDIVRLIEVNNAHVLSLLSHIDNITGRLHLVIKIDLEDASPVIRSFERFNYTILYYFMKKGVVDDVLQRRMEELVRYMNI
ncbi:MAG: CBS domain-containing protein [Parabacteroides sp.]|nr:CBS domain-containing protein [Parabacteroides sp.]